MVCRCVDVTTTSKYVNVHINRPSRCASAGDWCCLQTDLILIGRWPLRLSIWLVTGQCPSVLFVEIFSKALSTWLLRQICYFITKWFTRWQHRFVYWETDSIYTGTEYRVRQKLDHGTVKLRTHGAVVVVAETVVATIMTTVLATVVAVSTRHYPSIAKISCHVCWPQLLQHIFTV